MKRIGKSLSLAALGAAVALAACGSKETRPNPEGPEWVDRGSGAFSEGGRKVFYGVGSATGIKNRPLARTTSENRARAEISKIFKTYSASLMKDYMASTTAGDMSASSEEQHVEQAIKTFSATTLSGVQIVEHWRDPSDGTMFSLARLDLDAFKDSLEKANELSASVRDYVRKNAEKAFDGLEAEEAKH